jgi:tRNA A-37 threonylcarbamoyl transferase component Bud32
MENKIDTIDFLPQEENPKIDINTIAEEIEKLLDELPDSPKKKELEQLYETCENSELKNVLENIKDLKFKIAERENFAFSDFETTEDFAKTTEEIEMEKSLEKKIKQIIDEAMNNGLTMLGEGQTAKVFESKLHPSYCYKIIVDPKEYKKGKTVKDELIIMDDLADFEVAGVRSPKPYFYKMTKNFHILIMETLDAVTVREAVNKETKLPENFDYDNFFECLEKYIEALHKKGIHHRDFHDGNLMIDRKTGLPVVIDFGKSQTNAFGDNDEIYTDKTINDQIVYTEDKEYIKQHKAALKKYK